MSQEDDLARMRAESDQSVEALRELGRAVWAYYSGLLEVGFDKKQALALTISMQAANIAKGPSDDG